MLFVSDSWSVALAVLASMALEEGGYLGIIRRNTLVAYRVLVSILNPYDNSVEVIWASWASFAW